MPVLFDDRIDDPKNTAELRKIDRNTRMSSIHETIKKSRFVINYNWETIKTQFIQGMLLNWFGQKKTIILFKIIEVLVE